MGNRRNKLDNHVEIQELNGGCNWYRICINVLMHACMHVGRDGWMYVRAPRVHMRHNNV
jgi:hypothetical protein